MAILTTFVRNEAMFFEIWSSIVDGYIVLGNPLHHLST